MVRKTTANKGENGIIIVVAGLIGNSCCYSQVAAVIKLIHQLQQLQPGGSGVVVVKLILQLTIQKMSAFIT